MTFTEDAQANLERDRVLAQAVSEGRSIELARRHCSRCGRLIQVQAATLRAAAQSLKSAYAQHMAEHP